METTRVLIDPADPCPDCGAAATVLERSVDDRGLVWVEECRECSHGCTEVAAAIRAGAPAGQRRRRRVA
jgi:hypothetical protein